MHTAIDRHVLPRTGLPPLEFEGKVLATAGSRPDAPPGRPMRWYCLKLFETVPCISVRPLDELDASKNRPILAIDLDGPLYVVHICYHTEAAREHNNQSVLVGTIDVLRDELEHYDWMFPVLPFPPEAKWDDRRKDREVKILAHAEATLGHLWELANITESLEDYIKDS